MADIHQILKNVWGYVSFRPLQEEIIQAVLQKKDTLALMPTGGGKSICYQVPALAMDGLCLVISPLIALMKDQVETLRKKNITAFAIHSGMTRKEVINSLRVAAGSNCKFLYVSPERLETALFKEYLPALRINLVAVDEAHCISQWGYDFRPAYLRIAALREELPNTPVLALTASATEEVQADICEKLIFRHTVIFRQSFERPNLSYSVFQVDTKINKLLDILNNVPGSSIVYCKSRKRTREICELLQLQNISADYYHAGLTQEERNKKQEDWIENRIRVIVCTNAFGMGIDKPDVRTVVHADVPDCLESYYQEAGRAGRDGKKSYAVLLYDRHDLTELDSLADIRYPAKEDIKLVYQAIANYLQIPAGAGEGNYFDFDLNDFIKTFRLNSYTVIYALKALEQEGWLAFNEQVFLPAVIHFTCSKSYLHEFEKTHPDLEPVIKTLLRAYEGIFDFPAIISERTIAKLIGKTMEDTSRQLQQLQHFGIIAYEQQKDSPQLFFLRNRATINDLTINTQAYRLRKDKFRQRVAQMIAYIHEEHQCRSRLIARYFGDNKLADCGICDNCLRKKNVTLSKEEFEQIRQLILQALETTPSTAKDLLAKLKTVGKDKAWKVLDHLQAENMLVINKKGQISRH